MSVMIIAEMGVCHDGSVTKALKLCDAAKGAGADVVKTQTFLPDKLLRPGNPHMDMARQLALSFVATRTIANHCGDIGIEFCSTPDDIDSLNFLVEECGVKRIKIGSGSLFYRPLVDAAFDTGLPVLMSTGMATLREVEEVVLRQYFRRPENRSHLTLMHCVSLYPCPTRLADVRRVTALGYMLGGDIGRSPAYENGKSAVGYSDHTIGNYAVMAAVALGTTAIEKHFTLDNEAEGPDHRMSATPEQFETMVMKVRQTEIVLGSGRKEPSPEEAAMIGRLRKDRDGFQPGL